MKIPFIKTIILFISFNMVFCVLYSNTNSNEQLFFKPLIYNHIDRDLVGFLKNIPKNKGQKKYIDRILVNSSYKNLLLLVESPFSHGVVRQVSQLDNPFVYIEILDILSSNENLDDLFSNWYLTKLTFLAKNNPQKYMTSYLRIISKSDGIYAEWFIVPLEEIMTSNYEAFSLSMKQLAEYKKICAIINTGSEKLSSICNSDN